MRRIKTSRLKRIGQILVLDIAMAGQNFQYDICLSFAGEDRDYVEKVAAHLASVGVTVFYDRYEQADLWGKDLYVHLDEVYRKKARYCVVFISEHYAKKLWTNHERKSAQARAFAENTEYLLPARFDGTDIPGILPTVGFISLQGLTPEAFSGIIKSKLDAKASEGGAVKPPDQFRRIHYQGFDCSHLTQKEIKKTLGGLWLIGKKAHWWGRIADGIYRLSNLTGPNALLSNNIRYYQPEDCLVDLGNCRVSVRVRIEPPNDSNSGAGLLFRAAVGGELYYAFFLHPGNSVSLAETQSGKLSFLWSQEIPEVKPGSFVTLKVAGQGPALTLYVNDSLIHRITDTSLHSGSTGVVALSIGNYAFDDFSIYLPNPVRT
jgi:hypothetical protein